MALANLGCLLAERQSISQGRPVLMIDWDLEAPGLHLFFRDWLARGIGAAGGYGKFLANQPGLIELMWRLKDVVFGNDFPKEEPRAHDDAALRGAVDLRQFIVETDIPRLHLLKAGRLDGDYPTLVGRFPWEDTFDRCPWIFSWFADWLADQYEFVLVDSRTGVMDTSGICTALLPEAIVAVFTPNRQSLEGVLELIERATAYRSNSDDIRPLMIFPLPSRIELSMDRLRKRWRSSEEVGYQPRFEALFKKLFCLEECDLTEYFDAVLIQQTKDFAYGEQIAVLTEEGGDRLSLATSYRILADRLLNQTTPWGPTIAAERSGSRSSIDETTWESRRRDTQQAARLVTRTAFLSSTGADLAPFREAVFNAINRLDGWKCVRMEDFGVRHWDVESFCLKKVAECDLFVGIVGHRFGSHPPKSKRSNTQREYAAAKGRPRLIFLASDDFPVPANLREPEWKLKAQARFRQLIRAEDSILATDFRSPEQLATQVIVALRNWEREQAQEPKAGRHETEDPGKYLRHLRQESASIEVRGFQTGQREGYRFPIDELYTPLTTLLASESAAQKRKRTGEEMERPKPVPLQQALSADRLVIVGDPGSGKTTFLRWIAFACCQALLEEHPGAVKDLLNVKERPFPILISAATLAEFIGNKRHLKDAPAGTDSPEWLPFYMEWLSNDRGWGLSAAFFTHKLHAEGALLLIDGLDETPSPQARRELANMARLAVSRFARTRIVVTSRPAAYGGETELGGFSRVDIGPLDDVAIATFLGNWCRLLHSDAEAARHHLDELQAAIHSRPEIAEMAVNAVMLTALAVVHWNEKRLPNQRAELYEAVLYWLARASEEKHGDLRADLRLGLLARLALSMHTAAKGKRVEIEPGPAAQAIAPRFRDLPEDERIRAAEVFLENEELHSGIVVLRNGRLRFWHQTFQEYLAAKALAEDDQGRERILIREGKLYLPDWRETALLLADVMRRQGVERMDLLVAQVLDSLGDEPTLEDQARCVGVIGAMLRDLEVTKYRIEDPRWSRLKTGALRIFDRDAARTVDFAVRLDAADIIGDGLTQDRWVRIEGGTFWMGAQKADENAQNFDPQAYEDEVPVHQVTVRTFEMAQFPVTVREYEAFVNAGGAQPDDWSKQLRFPNRPVVNVSWHDAVAYAASLGCRLPTEAEWEYAARNGPEGTRYPWGNGPSLDASRANYYETGPKHLAPVGLYPEGATKAGVQDMLGNVWEWCSDWFAEGYYRASPFDDPRGTDEGVYKSLRGGSWYSFARYSRVSYRDRYLPVVRGNNLGFRCVREVIP
jgi:formylglycine-generating enzyme required for sulfatase activity